MSDDAVPAYTGTTKASIARVYDAALNGKDNYENTHQVAQRIQPDARVVYVDNDPVVLAHGRALLVENKPDPPQRCRDLRTHQIFDDENVRKYPENEYTEVARSLEQVFVHSTLGSGWFHTRAEIFTMLPGLELVEPGLTRGARTTLHRRSGRPHT